MAAVFVSHASRDDDLAIQLVSWLAEHGYTDCFVDHASIDSGAKWAQELRRAQAACRVVLCLVTPAWLSSDECLAEFLAGWYQGKRVIPLLAVDTSPLDERQQARLGRLLAEDQGFDLSPALVGAILDMRRLTDLGGPLLLGLRAAGALANVGLDPHAFEIDRKEHVTPYPGLDAFDDTDASAALFFGRSAEIARCLEDLREMRAGGTRLLYAIVGSSGAGKSSLMRAGVMPRLRREHGWVVPRAFRPGADPLLNFATAIAESLRALGAAAAAGPIRDKLHAQWKSAFPRDGGGTDIAAARDALTFTLQSYLTQVRSLEGRPDATVLLVLDQAEELVSHANESADSLVDCLRLLAQSEPTERDRSSQVVRSLMVALTLRTEALGALQRSDRFRGLELRCADLRSVPRHRLGEIIEGPAARFGLRVESDLVDKLIADAPSDDMMPLLSFALERMSRACDPQKGMGGANYEAVGKLNGLINDAAERALRGIRPNQDTPLSRELSGAIERVAKRTFVPHLAQLLESGATVRRVAPVNRFDEAQLELLRPFIAWRLLVSKGDGQSGPVTIEFPHEAIIRAWIRLQRWIEPERERLQALHDLQSAAALWDSNARHTSRIAHHGRRLRNALALLEHPDFGCTIDTVASDYLDAATRSARRRTVVAVAALGAMATVVGAASIGVADARASTQAMEAMARLYLRDGYVTGGGLFAVAGAAHSSNLLRHFGSTSTGESLWASTLPLKVLLSVPSSYAASQAEITPDGTRVVTSSDSDGGAIWDVDHSTLLSEIGANGSGAAVSVLLSKDGRRVLARSRDSGFTLWALDTGRKVMTAPAGTLAEGGARLLPKSGRMLSVSPTGTSVLWDLETGARVATLGREGAVTSVLIFEEPPRAVVRTSTDGAELWETVRGRKIATLAGDGGYIAGLYRHPETLLIGAVPRTGGVSIFDATTGKLRLRLADTGPITNGTTSADYQYVITRSTGNRLRSWDLNTGKQLADLGDVASGSSYFMSTSSVVAIRRPDNSGVLIDVRGNLLASIPAGQLKDLVISVPTARVAFLTNGGAARLLDGSSGALLADLAAGGVTRVQFSPDGKRLALASDAMPGSLWDAVRGSKLTDFGYPGEDYDGVFSSDSQRYVTLSRDLAAGLWDASMGRRISSLGGDGASQSAALSADGTRVAIRSISQTLLVLDIASAPTGLQGPQLREHVCNVNRGVMGVFPSEIRQGKVKRDIDVSPYLRGRPWSPCDWEGWGSWNGWRQQVRYWAVKAGLPWDYRCGEAAPYELASQSAAQCSAANAKNSVSVRPSHIEW